MNTIELVEHAARALRERRTPLRLTFRPAAGNDAFSRALEALANELARAATVELARGGGEGVLGTPCLTIEGPGRGRIDYLALPEGAEGAPFVELLSGAALGEETLTSGMRERLERLERPAHLVVFMASACPHCPQAVRAATRLALAAPQVSVTIVDVQRFPELAERWQARAAPTTIVDDELMLPGVTPAATLAEHVLSRGTPVFEKDVLSALIENGRVDAAAGRIAGHTASFVLAWQDSTTSLRLGLMLAAQQAVAADPASLNGAVPALIALLGTDDATLRGDTADLLGQIGHPAGLEALRPLLHDPNPDVAEIAAEALGLS